MKRPWNRVDLPVYSISSRHKLEYNFNICTYVAGASMSPKRMTVAIYKGTKTLELASKEKSIVLQLLSKKQIKLIKHLGYQTGFEIDKLSLLEKREMVNEWKNFKVLKESLAFILLKQVEKTDAGDHILFLYDVKGFQNNLDGDALTLNDLRNKKLIRG